MKKKKKVGTKVDMTLITQPYSINQAESQSTHYWILIIAKLVPMQEDNEV